MTRRRRFGSPLRTSFAALLLFVAACGGGEPASPAPSPSPSTISTGSFADLPFSFDFGDGWVFGSLRDVESYLTALKESDPEAARKVDLILRGAPSFTSEFVAYNVSSDDALTPAVSCNTLDRGDASIAGALVQGEKQNVEALAQLPGIVGKPTSDRITLPVGETVRVRWRVTRATDNADITSIGYLFVIGPTVYTCVFSAGTSTIETHEPDWEAILRTFKVQPNPTAILPSPAASISARTHPSCPSDISPENHQAPEIEAILPGTVAGRSLAHWSVRGRCWLEVTIDTLAHVDEFVAILTTPDNPDPVNEADLVYGVAGRSDTKTDPPYFVFAAGRPRTDTGVALTLSLLFGGAGYKDIEQGSNLRTYEQETIGGKQVYVGTLDMVDQTSHQRGRPYLYQNDDYMFLVITDDEAWAEDAIRQLP